MWTKTRSLILSRILVTGFTAMIVMMTFFVPFFAEWYDEVSQGLGFIGSSVYLPTIITLYICEAFALAAMAALHLLLHNISRGEVFIERNTKCLRAISWACMLMGFALFVLGFWRAMIWLISFAIVMFGLIMRVLKNVFERAVEIKAENDFTI